MGVKKGVFLFVVLGLCFSARTLYAGLCDDIYYKAKAVHEAANEAVTQKDFSRAVELYQESIRYYEQAPGMGDCDCPKIPAAAESRAASCREMVAKCQATMTRRAAEERIYGEYGRAKERYIEGNTFARKRQWDSAIEAFEDAARIWEGLARESQSVNGEKAADAARQARDAADLAREYREGQSG